MYAMHLATGSTLLCKAIKCGTIKEYVKAAASIMGLLGKEIDYRRENPTDKAFCPSLQAVYNELQRWERVPNRREPFTLEMLADVQSQAQACTLTDGPDSLLPVLADWFEVGLFSGLENPSGHKTQVAITFPLPSKARFSGHKLSRSPI
jgi:hypothetical protein